MHIKIQLLSVENKCCIILTLTLGMGLGWHAVDRLMSSEEQVKNLEESWSPFNTVNVLKNKIWKSLFWMSHTGCSGQEYVKAMKNTNN